VLTVQHLCCADKCFTVSTYRCGFLHAPHPHASSLSHFLSHVQAYGKTTYLITSLQLVPRGTEGAVSLEGTMAGLGAAALYAATALALGQVGGR
jgi:hypothetical protein